MCKRLPTAVICAGLAACALLVQCGEDPASTSDNGVDASLIDQSATDVPTLDAADPSDVGTPDLPQDTAVADVGPGCVTVADCVAKPCHKAACTPGGCLWTAQHGTLCDDGNPCSVGDRCEAGVCTAGNNDCECNVDKDCVLHDDGNLCNGTLVCDPEQTPHRCVLKVGSPVTCSAKDDTWCSQNVCNPATGSCALVAVNESAPCMDDDPCVGDSSCVDGACKASGPSICQCKTDADCVDDADLCNGVAYCDTSAFPWQCQSKDPIDCSADDNTACSKNTCTPKTGKCELIAESDGGACDDGDICTVGDVCAAGKCTAGPINTCYCTKHSDCEAQEDDTVCNGVLYCDLPKGESKGECKVIPATVVSCATVDDVACIKNTCDPITGGCAMKLVAPGTACDDGDACTEGEICVSGECGKGKNVCPCKKDADCAGQDDGNLCNGTLFCNLQSATCQFDLASVVSCKTVDDTACSKNVCEPKTGKCAPAPVELTKVMVCDDKGDDCKPCKTDAEPGCHYQLLQKGETGPKSSYECDVGDPCTSDVCSGGKCIAGTFICACTDDKSCAKQDDGDLCNGTMFCNKAKVPNICEVNPATLINCQSVDDTECVKNICEPKSGKCNMLPAGNGSKCDDGEACTKNDVCIAGKCIAGAMTCECITNADCLAKDDGNFCNGVPYCRKEKDKPPVCAPNPASVVYCLKSNDTACIKNGCDPVTGNCSLKPGGEGKPCEDGSACTVATTCNDGQCLGKAINCEDGNQCTADTCATAKGCQHDPKNCDDGNSCTVESCDSGSGKCIYSASAPGAACNADGDGCTINDYCGGGSCKAGLAAECEAKVAPCQLQACQSVSKTSFKCVTIPAPDGILCDDGAICSLGGGCSKGKCLVGPGARYYVSKLSATKDGQKLNVRVHAVARSATGYVLAGQAYTGEYPEQPNASWLWARAVDRAGKKVLWEKLHKTLTDQPGVGFHDVEILASGEVLLAGGDNAGNGLDVVMARYDATGKALWQDAGERKTWDRGSGSNDAARAVVAFPGGGYALAGYMTGGDGVPMISVLRISGGGVVLWGKIVGSQLIDEVSDATLSADGALITAGWRDAGKDTGSGWLSRWDAAGNQEWIQKFSVTGGGRFQALLALPDGGFATAGWRRASSGKDSWWLMRTTSKGVKMWESIGQAQVRATGLQRTASGGFALAGWSDPTGASHDIWMAGTDGQGNKQWDRTLEVGGVDELNALTMETDGTLVAAGYSVAQGAGGGGAAEGLLIRADPWGHTNCAMSGDCAKLKADACDDEQPCTADVCEAASGCLHKPASDLICDLGTCTDKAVCEQGKCTPKGKSKLWAKTYAHTSKSEAAFRVVHVASNGTIWSAMRHTDGKSAWIYLYWLDSDGNAGSWNNWSSYGNANDALPRAMANLPGGDLLFAYTFFDSKSTWRTRLSRVKLVGGKLFTVWTKDFGHGWGHSDPKRGAVWPAAFLNYPDGTWGLVGTVNWVGGNSSVDLLRFQTDGTKLAHAPIETEPSQTEAASDGLMLDDGHIAVAGSIRAIGGKADGLLMKLQPTGKEVWRKAIGGALNEGWSYLRAHPAGGFVTVGTRNVDASTVKPWLARFGPGGDLQWQRTLNMVGKNSPVGFAVATDGRLTIAGSTDGALIDKAWLLGLDPVGQFAWERPLKVGSSTWLGARGLARLPDGGFAIGGGTLEGGVKKLLMLRTDAWGHLSCVAAGTCSVPLLKGCDDSDPCTNDRCDGAKGCVHTALLCDDGNPCTTNSCNPKLGCLAAPKPGDCDDGSACTAKKGTCTDGKCAAKAVDCDDGNACTVDVCLPGNGCLHHALDKVPCPVGDGCSQSAACQQGTCKHTLVGALHAVAFKVSSSNKYPTLSYPVAAPDGSISGLLRRDNNKYVYLLTVDKWGKQTALTGVLSAASDSYSAAYDRGLWLAADGTFWALFYYRYSSSYTYQALVHHFDSKGASLLSKYYANQSSNSDPKSGWTLPVDLLFYTDKTRALVNRVAWQAGHTSAQVIRTMGDGTVKWTSNLNLDVYANEHPTDAVAFDDGSTAVAGLTWIAKQPARGLLYKIDNNGKLLWQKTYESAADGRFWHMAVAGDGGFVLVGRRDAGGGDARYWIVRTDAAGGQRWQRAPKLATAFDPAGFVMGPGGELTLASTVPKAIVQAAQVVHLDHVGEPLWQRTLQTGASTWVGSRSLLRGADGRFVLTGGADAFGSPNPMLMRLSPWGDASCAAAGGCAGKKADGCDDGDACTADSCDAGKGCVHMPSSCADGNPCTAPSCDAKKGCAWQPKSASCDDGDKCTLDETCKGGVCLVSKVANCDDGNPCSHDLCDPLKGCQNQALNGTPCPSPGGCSKAGLCALGQCQPAGASKLLVEVPKLSSQSTTYEAYNAVLASDGGYVAAVAFDNKHAYLRTLDSWGKYKTLADLNPYLESTGSWSFRAMRRLAGGDLLFAGYCRYSYKDNLYSYIQRREATGASVKWSAAFKATKGYADPYDLVEYTDTSLGVIGGITWAAGHATAEVIRIQGNGKQVWRKQSNTDPAKKEFGRAGLTFKDGSTVVAGYSWKASGPYDGLLYKLDNSGGQLWKKTWDGGASELVYRLANAPDGGFVASGARSDDGKVWQPWLARADPSGKLLWHKAPKVDGDSHATGLAVDAAGRITLAGSRPDGIVKRMWMMRLDPLGTALWTRDIVAGASSWAGLNPLTALPGGGFALAGGANVHGAPDPMLVITDHWGNHDCKTAGLCVGKAPKDCDDGQPCTVDGCDAAKGCTKQALPDGMVCADGKTCASGVCK